MDIPCWNEVEISQNSGDTDGLFGLHDYKQVSHRKSYKLDFRNCIIWIKVSGFIPPGRDSKLGDHVQPFPISFFFFFFQPFPISNCNASVIERCLQGSVLLTGLLLEQHHPHTHFTWDFTTLTSYTPSVWDHGDLAAVCSTPCQSWDSHPESVISWVNSD